MPGGQGSPPSEQYVVPKDIPSPPKPTVKSRPHPRKDRKRRPEDDCGSAQGDA